MLNKEELNGLRQLLESSDPNTIELGLAILEQQKTEIRTFLPILCCQKLLWDNNFIILNDFLKKYPDQDELYAQTKELNLLNWALKSKKFIADTKKRNPKDYERSKADFLDIWEQIEATLLKSSQLETIYNRLSAHFLYEDNDYILATHLSARLYSRADSYDNVVQLAKLLVYYHFPNQSLLKLYPKISSWIENYKTQCLTNLGVKKDEWQYFFCSWLQGLLHEAAGKRSETQRKYTELLAWADGEPYLRNAGKQIYEDIYQHLSRWAAEAGDLKMAKFYYQKLNIESKDKRFLLAKSNILYLEKKPEKAIAVLFEGTKTRPVTEGYYCKLAEIYAAQGKYGQAAETLVNCIEHSPQYKIHIVKLIDYLQKTNFHTKADLIAHYERVMEEIDANLEELEGLF